MSREHAVAFFPSDVMNVRYFKGTDTLWIELRPSECVETRDVDANVLVEVDSDGNICAITLEHASRIADLSSFHFDRIGD